MNQVHLKQTLRRSLLKTRRDLSAEVWRTKSDRLCTHLQAASLFLQAKTILAYFSVRQEPDLSPLFRLPKTWGFPRCNRESLVWHVWSPTDALPLQQGTYGIPEPDPDAPFLDADRVDLILVPAVACDRNGYRLGYGAGFYDRLLSLPEWRDKPTIGIVFEFAHLPALPTDDWDQPVKAVCTETGLVLIDAR
jgi:5-formyltetrahydrofolate cyclo-ligase